MTLSNVSMDVRKQLSAYSAMTTDCQSCIHNNKDV